MHFPDPVVHLAAQLSQLLPQSLKALVIVHPPSPPPPPSPLNPKAMTSFEHRLARQNRLRIRAAMLMHRAFEVVDQPGQFPRASRMIERSAAARHRANETLRTLALRSA